MEKASYMYFTSHQIKLMKVSLAVAIIRKKPKGLSAREFTIKLSKQLEQSQIYWKKKAEELSRELLHMKQESIMKDITLPTDMENEELCHNCSGRYADLATVAGIEEKPIENHIVFIHNVTKLIRILHTISYDMLNTTYDTIHYTINEISMSLSSQKPITSHKLLCLAMEAIARLLAADEMSQYKSDLLQVTTKLLESAISYLTSLTIHRESIGTLQTIILKLSILEDLFQLTLIMLAEYIANAMNILSTALKDPLILEPDMIDRLGIVISTMDTILVKHRYPISQQVFASFDDLISSVALDISNAYPLIGFAIWRIHGLLQERLT